MVEKAINLRLFPTRIIHESLATTKDMSIFPRVFGVGPCYAPFSKPRKQHRAIARWPAHLPGLATAIDEISELTIVTETPALFVAHIKGSEYNFLKMI